MQLILLGSPGAGKGTQAQALSQKLSLPHVSTGNMLRNEIAHASALGKKVEALMAKGHLVSDELMIEILTARIIRPDCEKGFILDGFPRTVVQAEKLDELLHKLKKQITAAINIEVPLDEVGGPVTGRRTCIKCHSAVHASSHYSTKCPKCGGELIQRDDDKETAVRVRLEVYEKQTKPLVEYYTRKKLLKRVDGVGAPDDVLERLLKEINC